MSRLLPPRGAARALRSAAVLALGACRDVPTDAPAGLALEVVQGSPASARPGFPLDALVIVRVVDDRGRPEQGVVVSWGVEGGGRLVPGSALSGSDGLVAAQWTLGARPGPNRVTASVADQSAVQFHTEGAGMRLNRVDADYGHGCGIREDGLWCWGGPDNFGEETASPTGTAVLVGAERPWTDVAASSSSVCVLDVDGAAWCIGWTYGTDVGSLDADDLAPIPGLPALSSIGTSAGWYCGLAAADSTPWCWGHDQGGLFVRPVTGGPRLLHLAVGGGFGEEFACGLAADSTAHCWGDGHSGQLGHGRFEASESPVAVSDGHRFVELVAGNDFACGRRDDGSVWCWGDNGVGQLGAPGPGSPVPVKAPVIASAIAAGSSAVLARSGAEILVWGWYGLQPGRLASLDGLPVAAFSRGDVGCVLLSGGQAWCFGEIWSNTSSIDVLNYVPVAPD